MFILMRSARLYSFSLVYKVHPDEIKEMLCFYFREPRGHANERLNGGLVYSHPKQTGLHPARIRAGLRVNMCFNDFVIGDQFNQTKMMFFT